MPGKWRVTSQYIGGRMVYAVYRQRDIFLPDHSGNREYYGEYTEDRTAAQELANRLNKEDDDGNQRRAGQSV